MIDLNALGAFLSGAGAVIASIWAMRRAHRQDEEACEKRFAAFREGLERGEKRREQ